MSKITKVVSVGKLKIGGGNPVIVQSMTNTHTDDIDATVSQINLLEQSGCEMVRVAVPDFNAAAALPYIKKQIRIPLVADIHFDYRLALAALDHVDKLRINPGNIGSKKKVEAIVTKCKERGIPIRIGVNLGSIDKEILKKYGIGSDALVESAKKHIMILESLNYNNILISLKASNVRIMCEAYRKFNKDFDYPLHLGVTEAGGRFAGAIKSAVGIGALLMDGIGDTIRVSLCGDPIHEIPVAYEILKASGVRVIGREMIICPTCGRTHGNLEFIANEIEKRTSNIKSHIKIAVMGCEVNGPGEAKHADIGIALGEGCGIVFVRGNIRRKIFGTEDKIVEELLSEIYKEVTS